MQSLLRQALVRIHSFENVLQPRVLPRKHNQYSKPNICGEPAINPIFAPFKFTVLAYQAAFNDVVMVFSVMNRGNHSDPVQWKVQVEVRGRREKDWRIRLAYCHAV